MWIVNFLPDFVFHILLLAGLLALTGSFLLDSVPFISTNAKAIQLASAVVLAIALFFEGAISDNDSWKARVQALELKVAKAEIESADANTRLVTEMAKNREKITQSQTAVRQAIQQNIQAINRQCKLTDVSVQMYNQAVKGGQQ
jgi:hypothetical protein